MAPAAALLLALALGAETQLDAGIRVEVQGRRDHPPSVPGEARAVDLTALPRLVLHVREGGVGLDTTYTPRFSLLALGDHSRRERVHEGEVRLRLERRAALRLETFASGATGHSDLLTQSAGAGAGGAVTTSLNTQPVDFERARAGGSLSAALDGRTQLTLAGSVAQDGGTNAASRVTYPRARVLSANGELDRDVTRLDRIGLALSSDWTRIARQRSDTTNLNAQATWRRRLTRRTELRSSGGVVALFTRLPSSADPSTRTTRLLLQPAAQAGVVVGGRAMDVTGDLTGLLGANVDRTTGQAVRRTEARASLTWPFTPHVAAVGRGSGGLSWSGAGRVKTSQLSLGLSFTVTPRVHLELRGTGAWQRSTDPSTTDLDNYGAVLSLGLDAPPLRF